jgi:hypothetical protein
MSPEEKPPEDLDPNSLQASSSDSRFEAINPASSQTEAGLAEIINPEIPVEQEPVLAEPAQRAEVVDAIAAEHDDNAFPNVDFGPTDHSLLAATPIAGNLENMAANGGAIGSIVLGVWCVLGSFITNWSIINGVLGLLMGFWGLNSRKQRTAWIGIALCVLGILLALVQVSEMVNVYLNEVEEATF